MSGSAQRMVLVCTAVTALIAAVAGPLATTTAAPKGVVENCSTRSEASFPRPFSNPDNLVVGPLALVFGARAADDPSILERGWQKFPVLVKARRTVTVHLNRRTRRFARLAYGPLPEGEVRFRDGHPTVRFKACRFNEPSFRGDREVVGPYTFWSGGIYVKDPPACVPLEVYIGRGERPRRAMLSMAAGDDCE